MPPARMALLMPHLAGAPLSSPCPSRCTPDEKMHFLVAEPVVSTETILPRCVALECANVQFFDRRDGPAVRLRK